MGEVVTRTVSEVAKVLLHLLGVGAELVVHKVVLHVQSGLIHGTSIDITDDDTEDLLRPDD